MWGRIPTVLGMNTKDKLQFPGSKNLSHHFCSKIVAVGGEWCRQRRKEQRGNDRGTLVEERRMQKDVEGEEWGGFAWQTEVRRVGEEMKGNLIDEKEEQEKGVADRDRSTLETKKCRARPSEGHWGISGVSFDGKELETHPHVPQSSYDIW